MPELLHPRAFITSFTVWLRKAWNNSLAAVASVAAMELWKLYGPIVRISLPLR